MSDLTLVIGLLEAMAATLDRIAARLDAGPTPVSAQEAIREKRRAAGRLGAQAVKRTEAGTFAPAKHRQNTGKISPANNRQTPANDRQSTGKLSGVRVFDRYRDAFIKRHGTEPLRNAQVNSQVLQLVRLVGVESAETLVEYYLTRIDAKYTNAKHPIGLLLLDTQKLMTEMVTKQEQTMRIAQKDERGQSNKRAIESYLAKTPEVR